MNQKQLNRTFLIEEFAIKVIVDCITTSARKFRTRLEFKQHYTNLTNEKSMLTKAITSFEGENMQTHPDELG